MAQNGTKPKIKKPKKEGYLDKQSSFWKTYRKRWMVLEGHTLYSFKEEKNYDNPTEIFDLRIYNKAKASSDGKTGQFELSSPNDSRIFLASSEHEMKDWIKHIRNCASSNNKSSSNNNKSTKQKAKSVQISSSAKKNTKRPSVKTNKNTASSKVSSSQKKTKTPISSTAKKKTNTTKKKTGGTKKKTKPTNSPSLKLNKSKSNQSPKKSSKTPTSKKVTENSMNKHIQRLSLSHSRSADQSNGSTNNNTNNTKPKKIKKSLRKKNNLHLIYNDKVYQIYLIQCININLNKIYQQIM